MEDPDLSKLTRRIYDILGFNADHYEIKHLKRRIQSRMRATKSNDYKEYLEHFNEDPDEVEKLKGVLTVNVTEFFRNPEVYEIFRKKVIPQVLKLKSQYNGSSFRIWSLGCATGEEPYSISMSLASSLGKDFEKSKVKIYATDIDAVALETAKKGEYNDVAKIPAEFAEKYVVPLPGGKFTFRKEITDAVTFMKYSAFSNRPLKKIDVLFCRNTIIYFNKESKKGLFRIFNNSLVMGGYLVLGKSESFIDHQEYGFKVVERRSHIFQKVRAA
jgi:chemotaxis methyl-accepting protein methylase